MLSIVATPDDRGDPLFCIGNGDELLKYIKILVQYPNKHGGEMLIEAVSNSYKKLDTVSRRTMIVKKRLESIK